MLEVTDHDDSMVALQIARMHLAYSLYFPNPADYVPIAETNIFKFFEKSNRTAQSRAKMCIFLAMIETARANNTKACAYANEALALSPFTVWHILIEPLLCGDLAFNIFKRAGISYSETERQIHSRTHSGVGLGVPRNIGEFQSTDEYFITAIWDKQFYRSSVNFPINAKIQQ